MYLKFLISVVYVENILAIPFKIYFYIVLFLQIRLSSRAHQNIHLFSRRDFSVQKIIFGSAQEKDTLGRTKKMLEIHI